jgi:hypothetical protein
MYTAGANAWGIGCDQREAGHATNRQLFAVLRTRVLPTMVPTLVLAEVV